jgi:hypothetical protein
VKPAGILETKGVKASLLIGNVVNSQFSILKYNIFFTKQWLTESAVHQLTAYQIMWLVF